MVRFIGEAEKALGEISYDLTERMIKCCEFSHSLFVAKDIKIGENLYRRKYSLH